MNLDEAFGPETEVVLVDLPRPPDLPPVELTDEEKWRLLLWVKALRSGIFTQGREYLARRNANRWYHCCLGVGCEVAVIQGLDIPVAEGTASGRTLAVKSYDNEKCTMPPRVREWYGIPDVDVMLPLGILGDGYDPDEVETAAEANDARRLSFDQIADLIVARFGLDEGASDGE